MNEAADAFSAEAELFFDDDEAVRTAKAFFNVQYLFPWQRLAIANILDSGRALKTDKNFPTYTDDDVFCRGRQIVLLPTGAGKSLCFLVPALILSGPTLVIYPLLALMADQMRRMKEANIPCAVLKGGQTKSERDRECAKIRGETTEKAKVILANPEVLQDERLVAELARCEISHVVIDEAHCVSEWGNSFRPAYTTLGKLIGVLGTKLVTAFTATASPEVLEQIGSILFKGQFHLIRGAGDRENIHYSVVHAYSKEKAALLCAKRMGRPMIVFCGTRQRAEKMSRLFAEAFGIEKTRFYHAGMTSDEKKAVERWFFGSADGILAATCAYGMGIDKPDIRTVIHIDAPEHLENFAQESGRAGRDGKPSVSVLLWNYDDERRNMQAVGMRKKAVGGFVHSKTCRRDFLLKYLGNRPAVCSGCDICDARKTGKAAETEASDAEYALAFIKRHRRLYTREEIVWQLTELFNKHRNDEFDFYIWETNDAAEILRQLFLAGRIRVCRGIWKNRIDVLLKKAQFKTTILHRHRIFFHQHLFHALRWMQA